MKLRFEDEFSTIEVRSRDHEVDPQSNGALACLFCELLLRIRPRALGELFAELVAMMGDDIFEQTNDPNMMAFVDLARCAMPYHSHLVGEPPPNRHAASGPRSAPGQ